MICFPVGACQSWILKRVEFFFSLAQDVQDERNISGELGLGRWACIIGLFVLDL